MEEKRFGLGVFLYLFNKDISKVLLLRLNEIKRNKFDATWGNVGGKINHGETSLEACIREAEEEIGVRFSSADLRLLYVKEMPRFFKGIHAVQFVYGTSLEEQRLITPSREVEGYQWFKLDDLPNETLDPEEDFHKARGLFTFS